MGNEKIIIIHGNLNAPGYIYVRSNYLPFMQNHSPHVTLHHDNARPQTARITTQFLAQNNVHVLPWSAIFQNLNPIEHIWDKLGCRVRANHQVNNINNHRQALLVEWQAILNHFI
jgi:hypothetical protein